MRVSSSLGDSTYISRVRFRRPSEIDTERFDILLFEPLSSDSTSTNRSALMASKQNISTDNPAMGLDSLHQLKSLTADAERHESQVYALQSNSVDALIMFRHPDL
jgi:hypothetical protein